jgi:hypothetical protein
MNEKASPGFEPFGSQASALSTTPTDPLIPNSIVIIISLQILFGRTGNKICFVFLPRPSSLAEKQAKLKW